MFRGFGASRRSGTSQLLKMGVAPEFLQGTGSVASKLPSSSGALHESVAATLPHRATLGH